jgi:hypothetical protein
MWEDILMCDEYKYIVLKDQVYPTKDPVTAKKIPFIENRDKLWHEIKSCIKPDTKEAELYFQFITQIQNLRVEKAIQKRKAKALGLNINLEDEELIINLPGKQGSKRIKSKSK